MILCSSTINNNKLKKKTLEILYKKIFINNEKLTKKRSNSFITAICFTLITRFILTIVLFEYLYIFT